VEQAERKIFAIAEGSSRGKGYVSAKQALPGLIDQIDDLYNNRTSPADCRPASSTSTPRPVACEAATC
jgi:hypothetical protein